MEHMPAALRAAAHSIATRLGSAGHSAWLVGGAVRDLALGREPKDVDIATDARPEEIERLFPHSKGVGRAFGTMIVAEHGTVAQVTTFRSERGYSDARRPDHVEFGRSAEEDAQRRDFTCNALFLGPLDDRLLDPTGGLADLERRRLRCVGDPRERFREDGLRLVRMARFAAALELEVEPATLAAARECVGSIAGVSGERLLLELQTIFERPRAATALRLLAETGVLARALPGLEELGELELRWRALELVEGAVGAEIGFALLLDPAPGQARDEAAIERAERVLETLRPSRELRAALGEIWELEGRLDELASEGARRSARIRAIRRVRWSDAVRIARALRRVSGRESESLDRLEAFARSLAPAELRPEPWITSSDLEAARVPRGPRWGELLHEAESLQLDQAWTSRADALRWLAERATSAG